MDKKQRLASVVRPDANLREVEDSVFSVLPVEDAGHAYDSKVAFYDALIGNRFYNRLVWGNWPQRYREFCRQGLNSSGNGMVLDAGCGSLVFTVPVYAEYRERPVVLLDRSLGMLRKAKQRLIDCAGAVPENIVLLQGDALDLPFQRGAFETVLSFGMLHIFARLEQFVGELLRVKAENGTLFATSLAANNRLGRMYLNALHTAGEVGLVCSTDELSARLSAVEENFQVSDWGNMTYVMFAAARS